MRLGQLLGETSQLSAVDGIPGREMDLNRPRNSVS